MHTIESPVHIRPSTLEVARTDVSSTSHSKTPTIADLPAIKAKQKATWESGDFGQIARSIENVAEEFMARQPIEPGSRVLDAACGTGNLAVIAARRGASVRGLDIASNLIAQARSRATAEGLQIEYVEGDAEALPYAAAEFDTVVSMFGVMFAPRPEVVVSELQRVTRSGGRIALANWTPEGFIGEMFKIFKKHLPLAPAGVASPMSWGDEATVAERLRNEFGELRMTRQIALMRYPLPPAETVEFFRQYYGPTQRAFDSLDAAGQAALRRDLVELQTTHNTARTNETTQMAAQYLEVAAVRL